MPIKFDFRAFNTYFERKFPKHLSNGLITGFDDAVGWLTDYSRYKHPTFKNRSNRLAKSLKHTARGTSATITSDVVYSEYLYYGTRDHFIKPVKAKALSWVQNGQRRFSQGHTVSGIKKSHWIETNYDKKHKTFNALVVKSVYKEFE